MINTSTFKMCIFVCDFVKKMVCHFVMFVEKEI